MARWLGHKMQELKIPAASCQPVYQWAANFEGPGFVQITEDEFKARLPQVSFLFTLIKSTYTSCLSSHPTTNSQTTILYLDFLRICVQI